MPFQDFREFIEALQKNGELIDVSRPINLSDDVGKVLQKDDAPWYRYTFIDEESKN